MRVGPGVARDERLNGRHVVQALADRHRRDQQPKADRDQPQKVEPPVTADAQLRGGRPPGQIEPAAVFLDIDGVVGGMDLVPITRIGCQRRAYRQRRD